MARDLRLERYYPHPRQAVWDAITDADTVAKWLSTRDFAPEIGHRFTLQATPGPGFDGHVRCRVLAANEPHTLVFSWHGGPVETVVTFNLHSEGAGTRLIMVQAGFEDAHAHTLVPALHLWWQQSLDSDWLSNVICGGISVGAVGTVGALGALGSIVVGAAVLVSAASLITAPPLPAALASTQTLEGSLIGQDPEREPPEVEASITLRRSDGRTGRETPLHGAPVDSLPQIEPDPTAASLALTPPELADDFEAATAVDTSGRARGSLIYYEEALPSTLNPLYATSMVDFRTQELIFDRLFYAVGNHRHKSRIVTHYSVGDGGQTLTVRPKTDIRWHDGRPFVPADICFTVKALIDPDVGSTRRYRDVLQDCTATADTATIWFKEPVHTPMAKLDFHLLPAHGFDRPIRRDTELAWQPIGTGPMRVKRRGRTGFKLVAFANAHHAARIAEVNLVEGGDPFVQARTLMNQGVDGIINVHPSLLEEFDPEDTKTYSYAHQTWWFAALNTESGPLGEPSIRKAVDFAIGRDQLREFTLGRGAELVSSPRAAADHDSPPRAEADLGEVEAAMHEAGATRVSGRWQIDGAPVVLRVAVGDESQSVELMAQLSNQLRAAGFTAQSFRSKDVTAHAAEYDILVHTWTSASPKDDLDSLFHGDRGVTNPFGHHSPEADALLDRFRDAKTDTEANRLRDEWYQTIREDRPAVFLWTRSITSAWGAQVKNVEISPFYYFSEFDKWSVD